MLSNRFIKHRFWVIVVSFGFVYTIGIAYNRLLAGSFTVGIHDSIPDIDGNAQIVASDNFRVTSLHSDVSKGTLFFWKNSLHLMILDQYNSYGGSGHSRGLFRHTTHGMTPEHDIDLLTIGFTPFDHYQWYYDVNDGFRTWIGSLDLGLFTVHQEIAREIDAGSRLTIPLSVQRTFDQRQNRSLVMLGLDYSLQKNHHVGFSHTFTEHKTDLDATFYYQMGSRRDGFFKLNATLLDWGNPLIYKLAESRTIDERRSRRKYTVHPYYFSFMAATPVKYNFRAEVVSGILTQSEAEIGPIFYPHEIHQDRQSAHYSGILIEYAQSNVTAGLTWQHTFSRFSRKSVSENAKNFLDMGNRQIQMTTGAYAACRLGNIHLQNWISRTKFRDQQYDIIIVEADFYPFDFEEYRYFLKSRIVWKPVLRGPVTGVEWNADYRDMFHEFDVPGMQNPVKGYDYRKYYPDQIRSRNERLTIFFGFQFGRNTYLVTGFSVDVDGDYETGLGDLRDKHRLFDGGFARFMIAW